jgi:serine/threonine-protein kinase
VRKLGSFDLLHKLGTGATAEVYLAIGPNKAGATLFALKILLPHLSERADLREHLVREAKLASAVHHPNVAEVFDAGEVEGRAFLAMEYVRGRPLSALLKRLKDRDGTLSLPEACHIVREACLGLHEGHEAVDARRRPLGLVHRDVSPQNVMVREDGRIKVVDFGLARGGGAGLKGKLAYMAPEQVRNEPHDRRVDVFAAAAILFELVCGRRLHPGATEAELIQQVLTIPQPDPQRLAPGLPRELGEVMVRALDRDPERRIENAYVLAHALEPFVSDEAKRRLAQRMDLLFEPMPRTVEEARMAGMAQKTQGEALGAVRPITRGRPGADAAPASRRAAAAREVDVTDPAAPFPEPTTGARTDPAGTDPRGEVTAEAPVTGEALAPPARRPPPEVTAPVPLAALRRADPEPPEPEEPSFQGDGPTRLDRSPNPDPDPEPEQAPEPEPEASPPEPVETRFRPGRRLRTISRKLQRPLNTQQTVVALAAVAMVGGLIVGFSIKQLSAEEPEPPRTRGSLNPYSSAAQTQPPTARPAGRSEDRPPAARPETGGPPRGPRPRPPAATAKGTVVILAEPMAVVVEDGRELGTTPFVGEVTAGFHQFVLRSTDGMSTAQIDVTVRANEQVTRRVTLR